MNSIAVHILLFKNVTAIIDRVVDIVSGTEGFRLQLLVVSHSGLTVLLNYHVLPLPPAY
jgi:hypothetical protein